MKHSLTNFEDLAQPGLNIGLTQWQVKLASPEITEIFWAPGQQYVDFPGGNSSRSDQKDEFTLVFPVRTNMI